MARMPPEPVIRVRVNAQLRRGLDRLRTEKSVNVSAWVRRLVQRGLDAEFPDWKPDWEPDDAPILAPPAAPTEPADDRTPDPHKALIDGWKPRQIDGGVWASVLDGAEVVDLPENDHLPGTPIRVTDRRGDTWITTIKTVVSRSDTKIVVTTTGRPRA